MRGLVVPEPTEDFTADPVELFFDLAFVFAFSQLVYHLVHHPTWTGAFEAWLLFAMLWMAWSTFTWSANAVSGNGRPVRLIFLIATAATMPAAASITTGYEGGGPAFAISVTVILAMALAIQLTAHAAGSVERRSAIQYAQPNMVAMVLYIVGGFLEGEVRIVLWILGVASILFGTIMARRGDWFVRAGHFSERHGLILIIALGEVVVAIGIALLNSLAEANGLSDSALIALIAAGLFAGLLWWAYFDRASPAFEFRAESLEGREMSRYARDVYTYTHFPIVGGVIMAAAAVEEIVLHPKDPLPQEFRLMLLAGLVLFLGGVAIGVYRAFRVVIPERLAASIVIAAVLGAAESWDGVTLLIVIDIVLFATLFAEHLRVERTQPVQLDTN